MFEFLKADRFWIMVLGGIVAYLEAKGYAGEAERNLVVTLCTAFIAVRTADRFGENMGRWQ